MQLFINTLRPWLEDYTPPLPVLESVAALEVRFEELRIILSIPTLLKNPPSVVALLLLTLASWIVI